MKPKNLLNIWGVYILLLLIFTLSVSAYEDYTETGGEDSLYLGGLTYFNADFSSSDYQIGGPRGLSDVKMQPFVKDLDGDGTKEIVVLAGNTIYIYTYNPATNILTSVTNHVMPSGTYNTLQLFDVDGDNLTEIITANEKVNSGKYIHIIEYNGTDIFNQSSIASGLPAGSNYYSNNYYDIKCGAVDDCIIVGGRGHVGSSGGPTTAYADIGYFNSTDFITYSNFDSKTHSSGSNQASAWLHPSIRDISYVDYDLDGTFEYVFAIAHIGVILTDSLKVYSYRTNGTDVIQEQVFSVSNFGNDIAGIGNYGSVNMDNFSKYFTAPLIFDMNGGKPDIFIAVMSNADDHQINMYDYLGNSVTNFPLVDDSNGELISNLFQATALPDDGGKSVCVMGYNDDAGGEVNLLCGSTEDSLFTLNNLIYEYIPNYNISFNGQTHYINMIHGVNADAGNDNIEVLSAHGVMDLDEDSCGFLGFCEMDQLFEIPYENSAVIPIDYDGIGRSDIYGLTEGAFFILDDKYTNSYPEKFEFTFNPCYTSTWLVNTSVQITINAQNIDTLETDEIKAKVILYEGTAYEQESDWSDFFPQNTPIPFNFIANKTISAGNIEIILTDSEYNESVNVTYDYPFSVSSVGVEFGDVICVDGQDEEDETDLTTDVEGNTYENNTITSGLINLTDTLGWDIGIKAVWLMVMVLGFMAIVVGSFFKGGMGSMSLMITAGLVVFFELMMVILGFFFGIFGWGVLITLFMFATAIVGLLVLRPFITGGD